MKNVVRALIFISISLVALNCTNDETMPVEGKVQFALAITSEPSDGGRISAQSFPTGAYISLSIETASGASVYSLKKIDLIKLGDGYVTAPLILTEGSYRLTDFFVMSAGGDVLYATPKEDSPLATLVADPLPMNFSINADGIVNLNVQVVDVDQQTPQDFGYVSFGIEVVAGGDFSVSLFIGEGNALNLASGKLELYQGNELVYEQNLDAKVNPVNFQGDANATYTLFVSKEGYTIKSREYVLSELLDELDGKPLAFMLEPAFTMMIKHHGVFVHNFPITFSLQLVGVPGAEYNLTVDWGDGTVDSIQEHFQANGLTPTRYIDHFYSSSLVGKPGLINITGDIEKVNLFYLHHLHLTINTIDITRLKNLESFIWDMFGSVSKEDTPEEINISGNPILRTLLIAESNINSLDISNNPLLTRLAIVDTEISNENVNELIMALPERVGINGNDLFAFGKTENSDQQNLAILSEQSRLKLIRLRDDYGWAIHPKLQ